MEIENKITFKKGYITTKEIVPSDVTKRRVFEVRLYDNEHNRVITFRAYEWAEDSCLNKVYFELEN